MVKKKKQPIVVEQPTSLNPFSHLFNKKKETVVLTNNILLNEIETFCYYYNENIRIKRNTNLFDDWYNNERNNKPIFLLYGGVGCGKSVYIYLELKKLNYSPLYISIENINNNNINKIISSIVCSQFELENKDKDNKICLVIDAYSFILTDSLVKKMFMCIEEKNKNYSVNPIIIILNKINKVNKLSTKFKKLIHMVHLPKVTCTCKEEFITKWAIQNSIKLSKNVIKNIAIFANQDLRRLVNLLNVMKLKRKKKYTIKDYNIIKSFSQIDESPDKIIFLDNFKNKNLTIKDFNQYNYLPIMSIVYENMLNFKWDHLEDISNSYDNLIMSDSMKKYMFQNQNWEQHSYYNIISSIGIMNNISNKSSSSKLVSSTLYTYQIVCSRNNKLYTNIRSSHPNWFNFFPNEMYYIVKYIILPSYIKKENINYNLELSYISSLYTKIYSKKISAVLKRYINGLTK